MTMPDDVRSGFERRNTNVSATRDDIEPYATPTLTRHGSAEELTAGTILSAVAIDPASSA